MPTHEDNFVTGHLLAHTVTPEIVLLLEKKPQKTTKKAKTTKLENIGVNVTSFDKVTTMD